MKKFITYFFFSLGVIFFILLCGVAYVWFVDPFGIRPVVDVFFSDDATADAGSSSKAEEDTNPLLSPTQENALKTIGIDPAKVPSTITPEMKACFETKLGAARVAEIVGGAAPSPEEVFATRSCYSN